MTTPPASARRKITVPTITAMKASGTKIAMITAYDATFAAIVDAAGVDMILVGDSVATVVQGEHTTIPVSLDEMAYHVRLVARARTAALVIGDLPFGSYQVSPQQALESAVRLMKAGAGCVKLEGGVVMADTIAAIARVDIPVVGHIGLTPQSYHRMGGHRVQGRQAGHEAGGRDRLLDDAVAIEQAGAFALVIEGVPRPLAAEITAKVSIPTIGIGAGPDCDGQVQVMYDLLGYATPDERIPRHAKNYATLGATIAGAVGRYVAEVREGTFPGEEHGFTMEESVLAALEDEPQT